MVLFQKERTLNTILVFFKRFQLDPSFQTPLEALFTIWASFILIKVSGLSIQKIETYGILMNEIDPFFRADSMLKLIKETDSGDVQSNEEERTAVQMHMKLSVSGCRRCFIPLWPLTVDIWTDRAWMNSWIIAGNEKDREPLSFYVLRTILLNFLMLSSFHLPS